MVQPGQMAGYAPRVRLANVSNYHLVISCHVLIIFLMSNSRKIKDINLGNRGQPLITFKIGIRV